MKITPTHQEKFEKLLTEEAKRRNATDFLKLKITEPELAEILTSNRKPQWTK